MCEGGDRLREEVDEEGDGEGQEHCRTLTGQYADWNRDRWVGRDDEGR